MITFLNINHKLKCIITLQIPSRDSVRERLARLLNCSSRCRLLLCCWPSTGAEAVSSHPYIKRKEEQSKAETENKSKRKKQVLTVVTSKGTVGHILTHFSCWSCWRNQLPQLVAPTHDLVTPCCDTLIIMNYLTCRQINCSFSFHIMYWCKNWQRLKAILK